MWCAQSVSLSVCVREIGREGKGEGLRPKKEGEGREGNGERERERERDRERERENAGPLQHRGPVPSSNES